MQTTELHKEQTLLLLSNTFKQSCTLHFLTSINGVISYILTILFIYDKITIRYGKKSND